MAKRNSNQGSNASGGPRPLSRLGGGLPTINYVTNGDRVNELFDQIVQIALPRNEIFNRLGTLVSVHPDRGVQTLTPQNLNGLLSSMAEIHCLYRGFTGVRSKGYRLLAQNQAAAFVQSPRIISQFPTLKHYTRSPQFDTSWRLIATPGYDSTTGVYYAGPTIQCAKGTALLDRLLSEFCWKSPVDRVNYIGMLLTGVTIIHWPGRHPLSLFKSNQPRLGKTLLARLLSLTLHGSCHTISYNLNDDEFEKQIGTRVDAGDQVINIDNAKRTQRFRDDSTVVESAVLERCITDTVLNFRRLGSNTADTAIRRPNDVLFCITMNNPTLGLDLRQRSIPIGLEFFGDVRTRAFLIPDVDLFLVDHRWEILAEILGFADRWVRAGFPMPEQPARHSISQTWAATNDAILRFNGLTGFLQGPNEADNDSERVDFDYSVMEQVCDAFHDAPLASAKVWAGRLRELGLLRERLNDKSGAARSDQAQATIVGLFFQRYTDRVFEVPNGRFKLLSTRRLKTESRSHTSIEYWFEGIDDYESTPPFALTNEQSETTGTSEP